MNSPYIICHMISSVNGKILTENWGGILEDGQLGSLYEDYHDQFEGDAWMCGRNTMEIDFTDGAQPELSEPTSAVSRTIFKGKQTGSYAIAIDAKGKLGWQENTIGGDAVISILSEAASDAYLDFLRRNDISYIVAGEDSVDFQKAFGVLRTEFGIKKILLEGGGNINGAIYEAGLIDELSLIILPIVDTTPGATTVFDLASGGGKTPKLMELKKVQQLPKGALWLNYRLSK